MHSRIESPEPKPIRVGPPPPAAPRRHPTHHRRVCAMMRIDSIKIGDRHRREFGDIDGLARSVADVGLLHPIVTRPDGTLIAGARRLAACKQLGWSEIPATVIDLDSVVRGEFAENSHRKDFLPSEIDAIRRALEPIEKAAAKKRQGQRTDLKTTSAKLSQKSIRASDKIGAFAGVSGRTVEKIAAVVEAAKAEPAKYGKLQTDMDRTGRVHGPFKRLRVMRQAELIRAEPPPLPGQGPYRVGVADPAWPYEADDEDPSDRGKLPYTTMTIDRICKLDVASIMHEDAVLWLWITDFHLMHGNHLPVLRAWGFKPVVLVTWAKDKMGHGDWLRNKTEHVIMAVRGKPVVTLTNQTTLLHAPVRGHSVKPVEFYDLVESLCPAPRYADLFSRYRHNDKWDCHGDEAPPPATPPHPLDIPGFLRREAAS
jgi:ParB/RepB/Spo0J family partition protein